jgi:hypothetical protein
MGATRVQCEPAVKFAGAIRARVGGAVVGAVVLTCAALTGCMSQEERRHIAEADSIFGTIFKTVTPADAAAWAADPHDADKRARGMNLLANAPFGGAEAYVKLYRERLKDENAPVRAIACRSLGMHGSAEDVPRLVPLTAAEEPVVRVEATHALQRLHNAEAIPALVNRLNIDTESEPDIRAEAACALGQYAESSAMQALIGALADPSLLVNTCAHDSLRTLTGNDRLTADRKQWVQWVKATGKPFANRRPYVYPVFQREKRWLDYVPFMPAVPNETPSTPVGFSLESPGAGKKP